MSREEFIGFEFGNLKVGLDKDYPGFIVNEDGFGLMMGPEFDDEFVPGSYGNRTYYMGTTIGNRTFSFQVQFVELEESQFKSLMHELRAKNLDILSFDQWPDFGFKAKLASVGEATYDVVMSTDCDKYLYNVLVDLEFVTVDRWWAEKIADNGLETLSNADPIDNRDYNMDNYLVVDFKGKLTINGNHHFGRSGAGGDGPVTEGTYYSEYGIAIGKDGEFIGSIPEAKIILEAGKTTTGTLVSTTGTGHYNTIKKTTRNYM